MGVYSAVEETRIKPFVKDALIAEQMKVMEEEKKNYIQYLTSLKKQKNDGGV